MRCAVRLIYILVLTVDRPQ